LEDLKMSTRLENERAEVLHYLPANTKYVNARGRNVWIFEKTTEVGVAFEIAIYYDPDESEPGYCAQLVSPEIEGAWKNAHIGHIFGDGVICFGGASMRTRRTLREAFSKSCLWAEGMAIMIASRLAGRPSEFPFSNNNTENEARS
jgi:hypothetical protein